MRVVSLVPSVTETLLTWGIEPLACTRFCEQPDLQHVGGTKDPDIAAIVGLAPDLVVVDREENRLEDYECLRAAGTAVRVLHIRSLDDVYEQLGELARDFGVSWAPQPPAVARVDLRVFVPIWRRPWIALGAPTYGTALLRALGVTNVHATVGPYPETTLEQAAALQPDLVLAPTEPYPFGERHRAQLETVAPTMFVDGRDLFWWGARTPGALGRLGGQLAAVRR